MQIHPIDSELSGNIFSHHKYTLLIFQGPPPAASDLNYVTLLNQRIVPTPNNILSIL